MAIGEAACVSVHGANRLGTNSLLDLVVFGRAAAIRAAETVEKGASQKPLPADAGGMAIDRLEKTRNADGSRLTSEVRLEMQRIMQADAAVFRTTETLANGASSLQETAKSIGDLKLNDTSMIWNSDLVEALELDNLMVSSVATVESAKNRRESRGAHAHEDFPDRDDEVWMKHSLAKVDENWGTELSYRPVHDYTLTDEVEYIPPEARVY